MPEPSVQPSKKPVEESSSDTEPLQVVSCLGLAKVQQGWVVVLISVQGNTVLDQEVLAGPMPKSVMLEQAKIEFVRHVLASGGKPRGVA
jgi:hypothetical protein